MRALVFGGTGMLGSAVVAEGRRRGASVLGLSHLQGDVADAEACREWAERFRPTVVFNCAAFTRVDDCETETEQALAINGAAVGNILAAAEHVDARLVHVSTDYVFAGDGTRPYREEDPPGPTSAYGKTKLEGERQALASERSLVVRTSWLFGPGGPNFAATMVRLMDAGTNPLRVVADQEGRPTYTPFLARALWDLAGLEESQAHGVVHYGNGEPTTWHGFAQAIAEIWRPSVRVDPVTTAEFPRPAPRPAYSVFDVAKFEALVGRPVEAWLWGLNDYLDRLPQGRC